MTVQRDYPDECDGKGRSQIEDNKASMHKDDSQEDKVPLRSSVI
jgi:hypothetical protein